MDDDKPSEKTELLARIEVLEKETEARAEKVEVLALMVKRAAREMPPLASKDLLADLARLLVS